MGLTNAEVAMQLRTCARNFAAETRDLLCLAASRLERPERDQGTWENDKSPSSKSGRRSEWRGSSPIIWCHCRQGICMAPNAPDCMMNTKRAAQAPSAPTKGE